VVTGAKPVPLPEGAAAAGGDDAAGKGIPNFWQTVFLRCDATRDAMNEKDVDVLRFLTDVQARAGRGGGARAGARQRVRRGVKWVVGCHGESACVRACACLCVRVSCMIARACVLMGGSLDNRRHHQPANPAAAAAAGRSARRCSPSRGLPRRPAPRRPARARTRRTSRRRAASASACTSPRTRTSPTRCVTGDE
jgi:hypothetical protein